MKPILGIAVLLSWFARCDDHGIDFPDPHHPHRPDAGPSEPPEDEDAGADEIPECTPTELYKPHACERLSSPCYGLKRYTPKYELWSDAADKERFIYLPDGSQINTDDADTWLFPRGTKIYKTFSYDGKRVETRIMTKTGGDDDHGVTAWKFQTFDWNLEQTKATELSADEFAVGKKSTVRPGWDIPNETACKRCHQAPQVDAVNGFSAIQLNHRRTDLSLRDLIDDDKLSDTETVTLMNARLPGDPITQEGLGYLHSNCGHCHNKGSSTKLELWGKTNTPTLCDQPTFSTAVGVNLCRWTGPNGTTGAYSLRMVPGNAAESGVIARMSIRPLQPDAAMPDAADVLRKRDQMPPLGTEYVHPDGIEKVRAFIDHLKIESCHEPGYTVTCPPPGGGNGGGMGMNSAAMGSGTSSQSGSSGMTP